MKLEDLKIVVSGAASGMGRHFAIRLAEAGARVAAGDVNTEGLEETRRLAGARKERLQTRRLDVADADDVANYVAWAHEAMGGLNALVNNAGIIRDGLLVKKDKASGEVKTLPKEHWDAVIAVNLTGAALLARDCVAKMVATGTRPGVVVNMSSIARHGNRGQSNYCATKAGLAAMTRTWALEWAPFQIRCGAVAPGMVETPMTRNMNQKAREALVASIPVGRIGEPEDLWLAVKFVLECDYFNARAIDVDGGLTI